MRDFSRIKPQITVSYILYKKDSFGGAVLCGLLYMEDKKCYFRRKPLWGLVISILREENTPEKAPKLIFYIKKLC